jgi:hypothetical protein
MAFAIQALAGSSSVVAAYSDPPALERQAEPAVDRLPARVLH